MINFEDFRNTISAVNSGWLNEEINNDGLENLISDIIESLEDDTLQEMARNVAFEGLVGTGGAQDLVIALNTTIYGKIVRKWILSDLKTRKTKRFSDLQISFEDYGTIIKFLIGLVNDNITGATSYNSLVTRIAKNLKDLNAMKQRAIKFKKMGNRDQHTVTIREYNNIKHTLDGLINSSIVLIQQVLGENGVKHVVAGTKNFDSEVKFHQPDPAKAKVNRVMKTKVDHGQSNTDVKAILARIEKRAALMHKKQ